MTVTLGMHMAVNATETVLFFHEKSVTYEALEDLLLAEAKDASS